MTSLLGGRLAVQRDAINAFNRTQARLAALHEAEYPTQSSRQLLDALERVSIAGPVVHRTVVNVRPRPFDWTRDECPPHGIERPTQ